MVGGRRYQDGRLFPRSPLPRKAGGSPKTWTRSKVETSSSLKHGIENEGKILKVTWADGETAVFHAVWLRHNCQCSSCVTSSNQKAIDPSILHPNTSVTTNKSSGEHVM